MVTGCTWIAAPDQLQPEDSTGCKDSAPDRPEDERTFWTRGHLLNTISLSRSIGPAGYM